MDVYKQMRKILWIGIAIIMVVVCISAIWLNRPVKFKGAWEIVNEEEIIMFYDYDVCTCDGDEMIYRVIDNETISLDGEIYEFRIIDRENKKMVLDKKE